MEKELNWTQIEKEVEEINKIVKTCPEMVQEKCFELLFNLKCGVISKTPSKSIPVKEENDKQKEVKPKTGYKLPGNVLVLLRKNGLSETDLEKLFMLDHKPILPLYKVDVSKMSQAQIQKVFMILLENALSTGQFKADYAEIRDACKEEGLFDGNFATNLKNRSDCFKGAITKKSIDNSGTVELSGPGMIKVAEIIKQLAQ